MKRRIACALGRRLAALVLVPLVFAGPLSSAHAQASEASALSMLPVAVVSAASASLFVAGASLVVVGVEASAQGTVWVLQRASDGARATLKVAGKSVVVVGTVVSVTAMAGGWVLSAAGQAIACVPDASIGALFFNERVSR